MYRNLSRITLVLTLFSLAFASLSSAAIREDDSNGNGTAPMRSSDSNRAVEEMPMEEMEEVPMEMTPPSAPAKSPKKTEKKRIERADAFVAGADWEFDGFVAGGQDQDVRTMFYQGDLVYLNIGGQHGVSPGDRLAIYKRGDRIRDPQTGKFIGYEVRRAAYGKASDRVESDTCSVRILNTFEAVEIGDLVRRE